MLLDKKIDYKRVTFLLPYLKQYKAQCLICTLGIFFLSILALPLPALNGKCVDLLTLGEEKNIFIICLLLMLIINLLKFVISINAKRKIGEIGNDLVNHIKADLTYKTMFLQMSYIDETNKGYIFSRINECENIRRLFSSSVVTLLLAVVEFILSFFAIFLINIKLAFVTVGFLPILFFLMKYNSKNMAKSTEEVSETTAKNSSIIVNVIDSIKHIKIFNMYRLQQNKILDSMKILLNKQNQQIKWITIYSESMQVISGLHNLLILAYAGYLIYSNEISIGIYITYVGYSSKVFGNLLSFTGFGVLINPVLVSIKRIEEFLNLKNEQDGRMQITNSVNEIIFDNVCFRYTKRQSSNILNNFSYTISKEKPILLVGNNGTGKTTLVSLILGLYELNQGHIFLENIDIKDLKKTQLRGCISYMSQEAGIFEGTLEENLLVGQKNKININERLETLELYELLAGFDYNLKYPTLHNGANLSGGQKQIISFLRVALQDRSIIILDEPTNSLDRNAKYIFWKFIKKYCIAKKIFILITHDENIKCDLENENVEVIKFKTN